MKITARSRRRALAAGAAPSSAGGAGDDMLRDGGDSASLQMAGRLYIEAVRLSPRYTEAYKNLGNLMKERVEWRRTVDPHMGEGATSTHRRGS